MNVSVVRGFWMLSDVLAVTGFKLQGSLGYRLKNKWTVALLAERF